MAERLSLYDYLAFVIPGATLLFVAVYGYNGWPRGSPGAAATIGLIAGSFVVGYVNAALGNWIEPLLLGARPGGRADPLWGTLGASSHYDDGQKSDYRKRLRDRYGTTTDRAGYSLAYTELQQRNLDGPLQLMNQHIGFARGMATACAGALLIDAGLAATSGTHLSLALWAPVLALSTAAFVARYRRFWRRFGDNVLRGVAAIRQSDEMSTRADQ
ncbi:MAG: hypothetical protein ACYCTL_01755 [Acidimicrobiales bacterium]